MGRVLRFVAHELPEHRVCAIYERVVRSERLRENRGNSHIFLPYGLSSGNLHPEFSPCRTKRTLLQADHIKLELHGSEHPLVHTCLTVWGNEVRGRS